MEKIICPFCNKELEYKNKKNSLWMMEYECLNCSKTSFKPFWFSTILFLIVILLVNIWVYFTRISQWEDWWLYMWAIFTCIWIITYNYFFISKVRISIDNNKTE
jgi:hypothetical protein